VEALRAEVLPRLEAAPHHRKQCPKNRHSHARRR
jgi:hypothetical protein